MQFQAGDIIHIYNRGNNKQQIFFSEDNYEFFLDKIKKHVSPVCDILAYCLMPDHFHFLVLVNEVSCRPKLIGDVVSTELKNGFRMLQSAYASAINRYKSTTGSLFQQKTKFKRLCSKPNSNHNDLQCCFHYIHQNPLKAGLVDKMEEWKFSSYNEYLIEIDNGRCNRAISSEIIDIPAHLFKEISYSLLKEDLLKAIF